MTTRQHNVTILTLCLAVCFVFCASTANAVLTTSLSTTAPTTNVAISQPNEDYRSIWRFYAPAGVDNSPNDIGQTFLVGPGGLTLDKVTIKVSKAYNYTTQLGLTNYDGQSFTLGLYDFTDATDDVPDPDKDSPIFADSGNLPANLSAFWNVNQHTYLTRNAARELPSPIDLASAGRVPPGTTRTGLGFVGGCVQPPVTCSRLIQGFILPARR